MKLFLFILFLLNSLLSYAIPCCTPNPTDFEAEQNIDMKDCCDETPSATSSESDKTSKQGHHAKSHCSHSCCLTYSLEATKSQFQFEPTIHKTSLKHVIAPKSIFLSVPRKPPIAI